MSFETEFWASEAQRLIYWQKPWETTCEGDFNHLPIYWFKDGLTNACYNCLDRHLPQKAKKTALIWQGNEPNQKLTFTFQTLFDEVCRMANVLKKMGVQKQDFVCIYLPMIPQTIITILACARIGAIHNVIFGGFSADAIENRVDDTEAKYIITTNYAKRGDKIVPFKENIDVALKKCPSVKKVLVFEYQNKSTSWNEHRDIWFHDIVKDIEKHCEVEWMHAQNALFILYTSGSTGKPKGILHSTGGYLVYVASTYEQVFQPQKNDIHWCTADLGWITGHSYLLYGPLLHGITTLIYEGVPSYPNYSRYWQIIDDYQVTHFYTAPTALRSLRLQGDNWVKPYQLSSLKVLGSVGEPINPDVWQWYYETIGKNRCPIVNTWWQTETGGILMSAKANDIEFIPGSVGKPLTGINPFIDGESMLYIQKPWPGMMLGIYNDDSRFKQQYFLKSEKGYLTGDSCYIDEKNEYHVTGRLDDVIKVSGHRMGTEELESAFINHPAICEAAVIGLPHHIKGECIIAFLIPFQHIQITIELEQQVIAHLRLKIGPIATPEQMIWVKDLPKTRSGKIMRRLLKKIATLDRENFGDVSTLADPGIINEVIQAFDNANKKISS